jgi:apolipoprotein N-acyltransferase
VFDSAIGRYGVLICYESAYEQLARKYRKQGAEFIVNMSNDAWFGGTTAPFQHEAHVVIRAIENRVGIVRAANNGISEFVDPLGRRRHSTEFGMATLYTNLGDWVGPLSLLGALAMCGYAVALGRIEMRL